MENELTSRFLSVIQLSITPVILISGVGALMITLTNRMGRVVDRSRSLAGHLREAEPAERSHIDSQLEIMWQRARLLRRAVTFAGFSMLISCVLVLVIFVDALLQRSFGVELVVIFFLSVVSLIAALVAFLRDIWVSLHALQLEVEKVRGK